MAAGRFHDLPLRLLAAFVLISIFIAVIYSGSVALAIVLLVASFFLGFEAVTMSAGDFYVASAFGGAAAVTIVGLILWNGYVGALGIGLLGFIALTFVPLRKASTLVFGLYGLSGLAAIYLLTSGISKTLLLELVLVAIATDTGAYLSGRIIGGPKLVPKISPSKTWAGFLGALVIGFGTGFLLLGNHGMTLGGVGWAQDLATIFTLDARVVFPVWAIGVFVIAVISGDLLVSYYKRVCSVKDSGKSIAGHGGLWDRFDGLCFGAIVVFLISVPGWVPENLSAV